MDDGGSDCTAMVREGYYVDSKQYGESLMLASSLGQTLVTSSKGSRMSGTFCLFFSRWNKLKARTDGALLDWTRQHVPPWDFTYLGCSWWASMGRKCHHFLESSRHLCPSPTPKAWRLCPAGHWMTTKSFASTYPGSAAGSESL